MSSSERLMLVYAIGLSPEQHDSLAVGARAAWRAVTVLPLAGADDALRRPPLPGSEMVVLGARVSAADRTRLTNAEVDGLKRWPVVILGDHGDAEAGSGIAASGATSREITGTLRSAVQSHAAMTEAGRARGDLWTIARRVSHEMRSPLGCILTSADLLREELAETTPAAAALVQPILESAHELMHLLERLAFIARATIESKDTSSVEMGMIVWAARERLGRRLAESGAEVIESSEWPAVLGRREWLECIWENLLANALQHGGPRPRIELGWKPGERETIFFARDSGPGVVADIVPTLFRPFHRLHLKDSGRGLGLSIVQRLVELQGGRCGYEASAPQGSYFFFTLPAAE